MEIYIPFQMRKIHPQLNLCIKQQTTSIQFLFLFILEGISIGACAGLWEEAEV